VLDAAAAIQTELRYEAPDVPRLVSAPDRAERGAVTCALLNTILDEAEWVAAQAAALLSGGRGIAPDGQPWPEGLAAKVRPSDIAVLCRKRSQFVPLRHALEARGIPVEVVGLGGLLAVPEVQDVVCTLRVLHDAGASDALARLLTGPRLRIGPRDLVALGRRARALASGEGDGRAVTRAAAVEQDAQDALAEAVTDLTAETGSLVEALDDLGEPAAYSRAGYTRMHALAGELRRLRAHIGRPLADLSAEAERVLGLDIEVAARPGVDPVAARADLDAFTDVADAFTGEGAEPTLGAFLAYLTAAQQEEFGLETGRVGESDSVKLLTVHAAKGLQWPAVFVPGLARGERSQVFPARPRVSTRWTDNPRLIPFGLRGDAGDLPELLGLDAASLEAFGEACAARDVSEERRLMYVAATRAAFWLGCSGYWWGEGGSSRLGPSPFLEEVRKSGVAQVSAWADAPEPDAENPLLAGVDAADWPVTPAGQRFEAVREAAALVESALAQPQPPPPSEDLHTRDLELTEAWDLDAGLLLAERAQRRGDGATQVPLPARLSVSSLVTLARDPAELARQVRRPMPRPPARQARRGTAFHQWLEQRYGQQLLIDDNALFGSDGSEEDETAAGDLAALRSRFEQGEWAERWPQAVEVPFETLVGGRLVRGRIDAVFADAPGGGYDVVDWKTGRPPGSEAERHAVSVQLAAYRLAWAALTGVAVADVRAAFYYVAHDQTVRPADLLDEAGLAALIEQVPVEA
jgi:DNA helicase-2/ATP-dependent DNA helicase PcrA